MNRQYRHKSQKRLAPVKPGLEANEAEKISEEITTAQLQKSVSRKRLKKIGVLPMGERVRQRLERRSQIPQRRAAEKLQYDQETIESLRKLSQTAGKELIEIVNRAALLRNGPSKTPGRVGTSSHPLANALNFLFQVSIGSSREIMLLRRNPQLNQELALWIEKANRIMRKAQYAQERKLKEKDAQRQRVKNLRKTSSESNLSPAPRFRTSE